ncbi:MAG: tRNA lysidine(34) synthetase TilS [Aestuariivita sp.]|nr:tRNA lysidine(34) synthetase TilS [Aestuariivita sp.]
MPLNSGKCIILTAIEEELKDRHQDRVGIAVSGGSDSIALLHAVSVYSKNTHIHISTATVDHGLRNEAKAEANFCAKFAHELGVEHDILCIKNWNLNKNLQDQARTLRYELLTEWAHKKNLSLILTAHTANDQAETVLMRLARAAGADGLAGIPHCRELNGITILRPLLRVFRGDLREYLRHRNIHWVEDSSNNDQRFERVRARETLAILERFGLTTKALVDVASNLTQVKSALAWYTQLEVKALMRVDNGDILINREDFYKLPKEMKRRLLVRVLLWIGGGVYPPRRNSVNNVLNAITEIRNITLNGCILLHQGDDVRLCREFQAVQDVVSSINDIWDRRWRFSGSVSKSQDVIIRALREDGLRQCPNWHQTGRPRLALLASPSVWEGTKLIFAPQAGLKGPWEFELVEQDVDFYSKDILD